MNSRRWAPITAIALLIVLVAGATAWLLGVPKDAELVSLLRDAERGGKTSLEVSFDSVFDGSWDHVVVACRGVSPDELDEAIGFAWPDAPDVNSVSFASVMVFTAGRHVAYQVSTGPDAGWPYLPCTPSIDATGPDGGVSVVRLAKADAVIRFSLHRDQYSRYWFVPDNEFARLVSFSG